MGDVTMAEKRVRIEHADGRSYDVSTTAFTKLYEAEGFTVVANADGTAIDAPRAARAPKAASPRTRSAAAKKGATTRRARAEATGVAEAISIDSAVAAGDPDDEGDDAP
jgi:hypothetical protein